MFDLVRSTFEDKYDELNGLDLRQLHSTTSPDYEVLNCQILTLNCKDFWEPIQFWVSEKWDNMPTVCRTIPISQYLPTPSADITRFMLDTEATEVV